MMEFSNKKIGERIKKFRESRGLTQFQFAESLGKITGESISRVRISTWESGERSLSIQHAVAVADFFGIDTHMLLTGEERANQTVSGELGLTDSSISYLTNINRNRDIPFDAMTVDSIFIGQVESEGGNNANVLDTLNLILSTNAGDNLLNLIGQYCFTDFQHGFVKDTENFDRYGIPKKIPCTEISFKSGERESVDISVELMRYSLLRGIEKVMDDLRENANNNQEDIIK